MSRCKAQGFTEWAESVKSRVLQHPGWYGRIPMSVLTDLAISYECKTLFGILSAKTYKTRDKCNTVSLTTREIAELFGNTAPTISNWLKELENAGHIVKLSKSRAKSVYQLVSPVFDYRVRVETAPNVAKETTSKELPAIRAGKRAECGKCRKPKRITSTSGICAECLEEWGKKTA